jgi:large subunit ribosomal protein L19
VNYIATLIKNIRNGFNKICRKRICGRKEAPEFGAGDTVTVSYLIREGNKERVQNFRGVVIQLRGSGSYKNLHCKQNVGGIGVERIFPLILPIYRKH